VISNELNLRVEPPRGFDEENLAQDFFTEDPGRVVAVGGTRALKGANDILREVAAKLSNRRVALHAKLALGTALAQDYKELEIKPSNGQRGLEFRVRPDKPEEARTLIEEALVAKSEVAVESFGHVQSKRYFDRFTDCLDDKGDAVSAAQAQGVLYDTMSKREVNDRKVLDPVLTDIKDHQEAYEEKSPRKKTRGRNDSAERR
jgi:hypothetical protein